MFSVTALGYNRPKLSPCASWNPNATTWANETTMGSYPHGIFVSTNNTIYAGSWSLDFVKVWSEGNSVPTRTISGNIYELSSLFVAITGDVYIDNGLIHAQVDKWAVNATSSESAMKVNGSCYGLFIDTSNTLYCSLRDYHQIVRGALGVNVATATTAVGNGTAGSTSTMLSSPRGIFVDTDFTLYVADTGNNRVQRFRPNEANGTTVAGSAAPQSFPLNNPTGIVLDADGYLFIMDAGNSRIVGSSSAGFRCLVGCLGSSGSTPDKLLNPRNMAFDNYGNMFVTDDDNNRVQKFTLEANSCGESEHI